MNDKNVDLNTVAIAELARDMKHVLRWLSSIFLALTFLSVVGAIHAWRDDEWSRVVGFLGLVLLLGYGYGSTEDRSAKYRRVR